MKGIVIATVFLVVACGKKQEEAPAVTATLTPATATATSTAQPALLAPPVALATAQPKLEPELVTFKSGELTLRGFLYKPEGSGPFPAVVYNHGSESLPGPKPDQATFYVAHGFVLFVPHRRGHGRSKGVGSAEPIGEGPEVIAALGVQNDDVLAAIAYVSALPYVNPKRIAVAGCSYGGIETLLAAERAEGIYAAVDFAGGAMRWDGDAALQERMKIAARNAKVPVMFVQAENDYSTGPSKVLSAEMHAANKPMRVKIYPANGTSTAEGHHFCTGGDHPAWGDDVLAFLNQK